MGSLSFSDQLAALLFPKRCPFCRKVIFPEELACAECLPQLPFLEEYCTKCGKGECECARWEYSPLDGVYVRFRYVGLVAEGIQRMKFENMPAHARSLSPFLAEALYQGDEPENFDWIIPVPMTKRDIRRRGYNQSELLARFFGKRVGLRSQPDLLCKHRQTEKQHELDEAMRQKNLKGCYRVSEPELVKGKRILLCDDVLTTGSTLREAARTLKEAGAKSVVGIILASTDNRLHKEGYL